MSAKCLNQLKLILERGLLKETQELIISLTSIDGKSIMLVAQDFLAGEKRLSFDLNAYSLPSGIYLLSIKNEKGASFQKVVKVE